MPQTSLISDDPVPTKPLRLRTFGATALERRNDDGSWTQLQRTGKVLGILIHLASQDGRRVSRERLADLLWGDEAPERARATLRQTLYSLRGMIGEDAMASDRDEVGIVAGSIAVDRDQFVSAARQGHFSEMLAVYTGPFCARLEVGHADAYERWVGPERERLRSLLLDEAERTLPAMLAEGRTHDALAAARQLAVAEPDDLRATVLLFDALAAAGLFAEARERLESARVAFERDGDALPASVVDRLSRLRRVEPPQPAPAAGTLAALGQRLVGRDATLDALLREAERAREGRPRRVVLVGPAGVGKSRVLDEFDARMRLRGARVVRVRLHPSMRNVPYSAFADTVRALTQLPAALGVSERSAHVLVGLLPELAARYPAARGAALPAQDLDLALRDAAADLFASVAEQRLVVHLVDDLHYADDQSRAVFKAVRLETERRSDVTFRLLTVRSLRRISAFDLYLTDAVIEVGALSESDVRELLENVAVLPTTQWGPELVEQLTTRSHGAPQLVLQAVRAAAAAGSLAVKDGVWTSSKPEALLRSVSEYAGPGPMLSRLDPTEARILRLLAAWGRPMDERDVAGVCARDVPPLSVALWHGALESLEELGLVQSRESTWGVAHDSVLEAVTRDLADATPQDPFDTLLAYWGAHERLTVGVLEHLSLLAGQREEPSRAIRLARRALGAPALETAGITARTLAKRVGQGSGRPDWEPLIFAQLGFFARKGERTRAVLTAGVPLLLVVVGWMLAMLQPRVVVLGEPMAEERARGEFEFVMQPRVALTDAFGNVVDARARIRVRSDHGALMGDTVVALDSGRAQFRRLSLRGDSMHTGPEVAELIFEGPWYARDARVPVRGAQLAGTRDHFRVIALESNGVPVEDLVVRASLRDTLRFDLTFEYSTAMATARYVVGASPSWIRGDSAVVRLATLASPVESAWRTVRFEIPPAREPGVGYLVVLMALEDEVADALLRQSTTAAESLRAMGRATVVRGARGRGMFPGTAVRVEFVE